MKIISIVIFLLTIGCLEVLASEQALVGKNTLNLHALDKSDVVVTVYIGQSHSDQCGNWSWGAENRCPKTVILSIAIVVDGAYVLIRRSAFSDLGAPKKLALMEENRKFYLIIKGGDAAESYVATLRFSQVGLEYRKVASGEFPNEALEETFYTYPTFD